MVKQRNDHRVSTWPRRAVAAGLAAVLLLAVLAAGATYVSFRVSVRFYRKRQNGAYT